MRETHGNCNIRTATSELQHQNCITPGTEETQMDAETAGIDADKPEQADWEFKLRASLYRELVLK